MMDTWIWWSGLFYSLCNLVATLHKSHKITGTWTSLSVFSALTLTACSRSLLTASLLLLLWLILPASTALLGSFFLNVEIFPIIVELCGLVREHLVQGFSFVFNSTLASVASEPNNSVPVHCGENVFLFLGNTLILFLASGCSGKTLIESLPGSESLCCFPTSIFRLLGIVYRAVLSGSL
jgi:hypothetical protein